MNTVLLRVLVLALFSLSPLAAAEKSPETDQPRTATPEEIKANLAARAKAKQQKTDAPAKTEASEDNAESKPDESDDITLLEKVTVTSSRISELDLDIKQLDKEIKREKKHIKSSDLDQTLNSAEAPRILQIFGGKSSTQRAAIAYERVSLMEAERDILEALKHVRTRKEEKELKEQLNSFKTMRLQLDETLR